LVFLELTGNGCKFGDRFFTSKMDCTKDNFEAAIWVASNSRFKLFLDTINLLVETSIIVIETITLYSHFHYSPESSTFFRANLIT
jgi:hypothetical protein